MSLRGEFCISKDLGGNLKVHIFNYLDFVLMKYMY